ncbi:MAG: DUF92 domain-containing protein [Thaumarchaeota archaeon]|nr:DUF92 domain-containing protein [Nitrososphaerota archaeon]
MTISLTLDVVLGVIIVIALGAGAYKVKALNLGGSLAGICIAFAIFFGGGWSWLGLLLVFFSLATFFTKFRRDYKSSWGTVHEQETVRGVRNAVANGIVAAAAAVAEGLTGGNVFTALFLGALATSTADTLATEIGLLSKEKPRLITRLGTTVSPGTSGGITLVGTLVGMAFAILISIIAAAINAADVSPAKTLLAGSVGGVAGMLADSFLGASLQARYRCGVCGEVSESPRHHRVKGDAVTGVGWVENNMVNFLSTVVGALVAVSVLLTV